MRYGARQDGGRRRRGMLLLEMLWVMALLSITATMAARTAYAMAKTGARAREAGEFFTRLDWVKASLSRDTWSATAVTVEGDGSSVVVKEPNGGEVRWSATAAGDLRREDTNGARHWARVGMKIQFEKDRCGLSLRLLPADELPGEAAGRAVVVHFESQVLAAGAAAETVGGKS